MAAVNVLHRYLPLICGTGTRYKENSMEFQDWIREESKVKKYISRQSVWEAALRHGTPAKQQEANTHITPCPACEGIKIVPIGTIFCQRCTAPALCAGKTGRWSREDR
jgi:hypothetical protein